jgi:hypothetical protein
MHAHRCMLIRYMPIHASKVHTGEIHAYEMHAYETHTHEMHAYEIHGTRPTRCMPILCTANASSSLGRIYLPGQPRLKFRGQSPGRESAFPGTRPPKVYGLSPRIGCLAV